MITRLKDRVHAIARKDFVRSVSVLAGGTAFAQALTVLALPILTRLYSPADFSTLAMYTAALAILGVVACLRIEVAIPLPERDEDAADLLALSILVAACLAVATGFVLWLAKPWIEKSELGSLRSMIWLLPIGVCLSGSYSALLHWATRKKWFRQVARTRVTQSVGGVFTQVGFGVAGIAPFGLLLGHLITSGAGVVGLARLAWRHESKVFQKVSRSGMQQTLSRYRRFPQFSALEALANNAGIQVPVMIIAVVAAGAEAGLLLLATRALSAPMALVGSAVAHVYYSQAPAEHRSGNLAAFSASTIRSLGKVGAGPLIFAGAIAPFVFPMIFGREWQRAGEMLMWMTPWFLIKFISSPVSMTLHVIGAQRAALSLQIFGFVLRVGVVLFAAVWAPAMIVEAYALSGFVFYSVYLAVVARVAGIAPRALFSAIRPIAPIGLMGGVLGWVMGIGFSHLVAAIQDNMPIFLTITL